MKKYGKMLEEGQIFVIWNSKYNIVAFSEKIHFITGFSYLIGKKHSKIKVSRKEDLPFSEEFIKTHTLFEYQDILLTNELDNAVMEFMESKQEEVSILMENIIELISFYKFTDDEKQIVDHFVKIYDYYFLKDIYGTTVFDILEDMDYKECVRMYLSSISKNK